MQVEASISKETIQKVFQNTLDSESFFDDLGDIVLEEFSGVRFIGEVECQEGKETYEELRACLDQVIVDKSHHLAIFNPSTRQLRAVFSLYFVWTGIFAYGEESGHDLWPPILRGISIELHSNLTGRCGELFMQCLRENGLEEFRSLRTAHPYVPRILLHGLIPDIHIERFINDIIKPELWSLMGSYNDGNKIIDKWCHEKHDALRSIHHHTLFFF
jgi:hypothetical protein